MLVNPLFDQDDDDSKKPSRKDEGYALQHRKGRTLQPISKDLKASHYSPLAASVMSEATSSAQTGAQPAIELIRRKVAALYTEEPDVREELQEISQPVKPVSEHQKFMQTLSVSGKSLAEIQTEWHEYYTHLSDEEKHEVWREFYVTNSRQPSAYTRYVTQQSQPAGPLQPVASSSTELPPAIGAPKAVVGDHLPAPNYQAKKDRRTKSRIKKQILDKVQLSEQTQTKAKQHFQSLLFGLGTGAVVLTVFLFGFFNEVFIAPFIQPSRHVSATPIIVSSDSIAATQEPQVIIPKINVQIPVVYDVKTVQEADVQKGLESGVVHYSTTVLPGQQGNSAIFGHSSNNIFNKGKYKFAFVLLHELVPGDIFHLTYDRKVYTYRVYDKKVVAPSEVGVLNNVSGKPATATLITCDPPGTSTNRLVVWGEQVSPDPSGAATPSTPPTDATDTGTDIPTELPSEGPTMWTRFWRSIF